MRSAPALRRPANREAVTLVRRLSPPQSTPHENTDVRTLRSRAEDEKTGLARDSGAAFDRKFIDNAINHGTRLNDIDFAAHRPHFRHNHADPRRAVRLKQGGFLEQTPNPVRTSCNFVAQGGCPDQPR